MSELRCMYCNEIFDAHMMTRGQVVCPNNETAFKSQGIPSLTELREHAEELAQVRVSVLLQTFAMPSVDEEQIRQLLVDVITTTYLGAHYEGKKAAFAEVRMMLEGLLP